MQIRKHFMTITKHRILVMKGCFKVGLYRQGLFHDLSKEVTGDGLFSLTSAAN